ncbi:YidB family protein [Roseateles toxinivorans]|nr:YidB family protein [Roseateles toxinivorans]
MMGLLNAVLIALSRRNGFENSELGAVAGLLGRDAPGEGVTGLVEQFESSGMGELVDSWIGPGENLPVEPHQIQQVLGRETLQGMADQLGLSELEVAVRMSQLLPDAVNRLTPQGHLPPRGLGSVNELLGRLSAPN